MYKCDNGDDHEIVLVEYPLNHPEHYDGVSEIKCLTCGRRIGRWCGNLLKEGAVEPRYCEHGQHPGI